MSLGKSITGYILLTNQNHNWLLHVKPAIWITKNVSTNLTFVSIETKK